jgi:hypothetical protein
MYVCSVCGEYLPYVRACEQVHAGVCHWCFTANMSGNPLEAEAHEAPLERIQAAHACEEAP